MDDVIISAVQVLASGDPAATVSHLRYGSENQRISLLQGAWLDITDMFDDADRFRKKYSLQHLIVAPYEPMTRDQMMTVALPLIATKLKFPACDAVVVEHQKNRSDDAAFPTHWHIVIEHFDPQTGKVRDWWKNRFKHELVGRMLEGRLGHRFVLGFYHDAVLDALRAEAETDPTSDAGTIADRLEQAFPRGSRPDGSTISKPLIRMHEAVGRDLVALRVVCRKAWTAASDLDQLNAALALHGLHVQIAQNPPPKWMVYDADGAIGSVAGMMHVKNTEVIGKLGDPKNDDWYRNDAHIERGPHDQPAGENSPRDRDADQHVPVVRPLADQPERHDAGEIEHAFEAALDAAPATALDHSEEVAQRLVMPWWQKAIEFFRLKAANARDYIDRRSHLDEPPISGALAMVRQRRDELMQKVRQAREQARQTFMRYRASMIPMPAAKDAEAHLDRVEALRLAADRQKAEWLNAVEIVREHDNRAGIFEAQHDQAVVDYRARTVRNRIKAANMHIRVAERCLALVSDDQGPSVTWIDPETLFDIGRAAEIEAELKTRQRLVEPAADSNDQQHPRTLH